MLETILTVVLSEYGILVAFLVLTIIALLFTVRVLWSKVEYLSDKLLRTVENNTKVITQLVERLKQLDDD